MITHLMELEQKYSLNDYYGIGDSFVVRHGQLPILLSAPHAVRQLRGGKMKAQDMYTGCIAEYVAESTDCFCITKTCYKEDDANHDLDCGYKENIIKLVQGNGIVLLIDLHGLEKGKGNCLDVCTDGSINLAGDTELIDRLCNVLASKGLSVNRDMYYRADKPGCVSKFISSRCSLPCIELEIGYSYRDIYADHSYVVRLIDGLCEFVRSLR